MVAKLLATVFLLYNVEHSHFNRGMFLAIYFLKYALTVE